MKTFNFFITIFVISLLFIACSSGPPIINDMSNASFQLINQDSARVNFSQDFKGKYTILSFIYTHCPDVCPLIMANMQNIHQKLGNMDDIQFVEITFDPKRDTPSVLKKYMQRYNLNTKYFTMLTGDPATVDSLMSKAHIKTEITSRDTTDAGTPTYFYRHTNRLYILDKKGRARFDYPASVVPPKNVIEDLNKIR